ncbi:MAG TPA: right-handed parallel beta-helix repeat-containing protein [Candidatus Thermoplasmatota archaeon]|nr:right-handed parallel beta-helix repeat-containing protein [Candidatus Thermoplasmatota archaeon]
MSRHGVVLLGAAAALLALVALAGAAQAETFVNGGTISTDTTWTLAGSPYILRGSVTISGTNGADGVTTLTIEPGVEVRFNANTGLTIGTTSSATPGALDARGTEAGPILFTSNQTTKTRGFWSGITIQPFSRDALTFLENATVEYAGGNGNVYVTQAEPTIRHAVFRQSSTHGLQLSNAHPVVESSTFASNADSGLFTATGYPTLVAPSFEGNGKYGLYTSSGVPSLLAPSFSANGFRPARIHLDSPLVAPTFAASVAHEIEVTSNATQTRDRELPRHEDLLTGQPLAYVMVSTFTVQGQSGPDLVTTLTLAPGVELRFHAGITMAIGTSTATLPGALDARGTAALPILLTSNQTTKTRGYWSGVTFNNFASDALTALENITVEYGGANGNVFVVSASFPIRDATLRQASGHGLQVSTGAGAYERLQLLDNALDGASLSTFTGSLTDATAARNGRHGILLTGSATLAQLVLQQNGQYGLQAASGKPSLDGATFDANGERPLRIHVDSDATGLVFHASQVPEIELQASFPATLTRDRVWTPHADAFNGTPHRYAVLNAFTVQGTDGADGITTLTVEPGTEVRFGSGVSLGVGTTSASQPGALDARGTATEPILFTSNQAVKTRGGWGGVRFDNFASDSLSRLENITIEYGGASGNLFLASASPPVRHAVLHNASGPGLQVSSGSSPLDDLLVVDNAGTGLALTTFNGWINDTTVARNGGHGIALSGTGGELHRVISRENALYGVQITSGIYELDTLTIVGNGQRPLRAHVQSALTVPHLEGNGIAEIELMASPTSTLTKDRDLDALVDTQSGASHVYVVLASFTVQGTDGADGLTTLRVAPGVEVRFAASVLLSIGTSSASLPGALDARGTTAQPILLTSNQAVKTRGGWNGVAFNNFASDADSFLENITIEYGGLSGNLALTSASPRVSNAVFRQASGAGIFVSSSASPLANVSLVDNGGHGLSGSYSGTIDGCLVHNNTLSGLSLSTSATLRDCVVSSNRQYGVLTTAGVMSMTNVSILDNLGTPLRMHVDSLLEQPTFSGNGVGQIELHGATIASDRTFALHADAGTGAPLVYIVNQSFAVQGTDGADGVTTLTLAPGVSLRFNANTVLTIGGSASVVGALDARGTSAQPILLTSNQAVPTRGFWGPLAFSDGASDALTRLENVTVEYGGRTSAGITVTNAQLTFRNVVARESNTAGIQLSGGYLRLEDSVVARSASHGVHVTSGGASLANVALVSNGGKPVRSTVDLDLDAVSLEGNTGADIEIFASSGSRDVRWPVLIDNLTGIALPYNVTGGVTIGGNAGPDGVATHTLAPGVTVRMGVNAWFNVGVSSTAPGALDARGTASEPIVFTSNQAVPTAGFWRSIDFGDFAVDEGSYLENVTVEYGGGASSGGIGVFRSAVEIRNSLVRHTLTYGIHLNAARAGLVIESTRVLNATHGIYLTGATTNATLVANHVTAQTPLNLADGDNSLIERNLFESTSGGSTVASSSTGNRIWDNVFTRASGAPLWVNSTSNLFNRTRTPGTSILGGPYLGGNAYSDYVGIDWTNPSDGLGDDPAPYVIAGSAAAKDHHPLVDASAAVPDTDLPSTTLELVGPLLPTGWYNGTVRIRLDATDATSGVESITRELDGVASVTSGAVSFLNVSAQGPHTLVFYATDRATNVEPAQSVSFGVDSLPPALALTLQPRLDDLCFVALATDAGSGVASLTYTVTDANDTVVTNATGVLLLDVPAENGAPTCARLDQDGSYRVSARAVDVAGHARDNRTARLTLDLRGPVIELIRPEAGAAYFGNTRIATPFGAAADVAVVFVGTLVVANASDEGSGIARIDVYLDGQLIASDTHAPLRVWVGEGVAPGVRVLRVVAVDGAGHEAAQERTLLFVGFPPPIPEPPAGVVAGPSEPTLALPRREETHGEGASNNP